MELTARLKPYELYPALVALGTSRFTGFLRLMNATGEVCLTYSSGHVLSLDSTDVKQSFPAYLLSSGTVDRASLKGALEHSSQTNSSLGHALIEVADLSPTDLQGFVQGYMMTLFVHVFSMGELTVTKLPTPAPKATFPNLGLKPLRAFLRHMALHADCTTEMKSSFSDFDTPLSATPGLKASLEDVKWAFDSPTPQAVCNRIDKGPFSVTDLLSEGHQAEDVFRCIYGLIRANLIRLEPTREAKGLWLDVIEFFSAITSTQTAKKAPPKAKPQSSEAESARPAPRPDPGSQARRIAPTTSGSGGAVDTALKEAVERLRNSNHYEFLDIQPDATHAALDERLQAAIQKYSASNYEGFMLSDEGLKHLSYVQKALEQVKGRLLDPGQRDQYHSGLSLEDGAMRIPLTAIFEAQNLQAQARERVELGAVNEALPMLEQSLELVPHDAHGHAHLALMIYDAIAANTLVASECGHLIDKHLRLGSDTADRSAMPHCIQGRILRSRGDLAGALDAYQQALTIHSRNTEARTAVRELRARLKPAEGEGPEGDENVMSRLSGMFRKRG